MSEKYPFTLIKEEIARRQGKALDFAVGTQALPLSEGLKEWIANNWELALIPGNREDIGRFTSAASRYLNEQYGADVAPQHILPTAGGRAAMAILATCTLSPSSTVIVTEPGYPAFARIASQLGATVVVSHLDPGNEFAPDFEYSEALARESLTMLSVNYPNNPSGSILSTPVMQKLWSIAGPGAILFNDATYGPLVYGNQPHSLLSEAYLEPGRPEVVELHSFSKLYPIGPLAVSFLAGSPELLQSASTYSEYAWSPLSRLQLAATARCLEDGDRIHRIKEFVPKQLSALQTALDDLGFRTYDAASGTYLICDVPASIAGLAVSSAQAAAKYLMEAFDIAVVPLGSGEHAYLRFSALYRPRDLQRLADLGARLQIR